MSNRKNNNKTENEGTFTCFDIPQDMINFLSEEPLFDFSAMTEPLDFPPDTFAFEIEPFEDPFEEENKRRLEEMEKMIPPMDFGETEPAKKSTARNRAPRSKQQ